LRRREGGTGWVASRFVGNRAGYVAVLDLKRAGLI
jgi:hypothetical protein